MIYIDIHRQRLSTNWTSICRFVLFPWGNYRELTVYELKSMKKANKNRYMLQLVLKMLKFELSLNEF